MPDAAPDHRNNVETHARFIRARAPHVIAGRPPQRLYFFPVDIPFRCAPLSRSARFDLDKHQQIALPGNEIDLAPALRRPPVARHHGKSVAPEIAMREILSAPPDVTVLAVTQTVRDLVQGGQWVQIRTPSLSRESDSRDRTPRTCGSAGTGSPEIRSQAIARMLVA